ncbi:Gfo/Idh/MocA family protein [Teichococcus aestuarii]|uniref:Glucose-fructose oxidoreductase n=1 Tax=Teichococcus aestuarii TaxID=568898 RepID=A0A2U1VA77_9PROT|nr:Gfo/Idh/MocA family oxidoreductase [Pseudoroseomonas aestuarii]PWC30822.1 glucose-fructose oxidoreductase [Pseudoroseomonas aestuarii]
MAEGKVRYAVVGGGWISQAAFMPAVARTRNSALAAIVTGDAEKRAALGARYGIPAYDYGDYDRLLESGDIDAVYLATPNWLHREGTEKALAAGIHVLLEKPAAASLEDAEAIRDAAARARAKLMVAYRLHFEPATLAALEVVRSGRLGQARLFSSAFAQIVAPGNHRSKHGYWAGPVVDMGPYPINMARHVFGEEPVEIAAIGTRDPALEMNFDDTVSVSMRFPGGGLAQFSVSYAGRPVDQYRILGSAGDLAVEPGFTFGTGLRHRLSLPGGVQEEGFAATDQFAGELEYFSDCVLRGLDPEPDGEEGWCDMRILDAIERALAQGGRVALPPFQRRARPVASQRREIPLDAPPPPLVNAHAPGEG